MTQKRVCSDCLSENLEVAGLSPNGYLKCSDCGHKGTMLVDTQKNTDLETTGNVHPDEDYVITA